MKKCYNLELGCKNVDIPLQQISFTATPGFLQTSSIDRNISLNHDSFARQYNCYSKNRDEETCKAINCKPNIMAKWLTLLFHIREVLGSNLSLKTGYID
jgi:hypothetical protein